MNYFFNLLAPKIHYKKISEERVSDNVFQIFKHSSSPYFQCFCFLYLGFPLIYKFQINLILRYLSYVIFFVQISCLEVHYIIILYIKLKRVMFLLFTLSYFTMNYNSAIFLKFQFDSYLFFYFFIFLHNWVVSRPNQSSIACILIRDG